MKVEAFLTEVCSLFQNQLGQNIVGIYLHGSLAMGCFHPKKSDVDVLVIVKEKLTTEQQKNVIREILKLEEYKLEMSILLEKELIEFKYPTPFELHYSSMHKERYLNNPDYLCRNENDPDLAAHLVVTYKRGKCLFGKPIKEVFKPIDHSYYIQSILYDIEDAEEGIVRDPVYYTLNLCRVLYYLKEGVVSSKKEGGEWGMEIVKDQFKELVTSSLCIYNNPLVEGNWEDRKLVIFAQYMLNEIRQILR